MSPSPSPNLTRRALDCLGAVHAELTAVPRDLRPFGPGSTLQWTITPPPDPDCHPTFFLNGNPISTQGSLVVQPPETTEYRLEGVLGETRMILARETVTVLIDHCIQISVPEQNIRLLLQEAITQVCASHPMVSERRQPIVEVDRRGVILRAYFKTTIENAPDPDLDVDCVIGLRAENGAVAVFFRRFNVDLDWPRWMTIATAGVSKLVEQTIEDLIEKTLKPVLLNKATDIIESYLRLMPENIRLYRIDADADKITVFVCSSTA